MMSGQLFLFVLRFCFSIGCLGCAALWDIEYREVPNKLWLYYAVMCAPIALINVLAYTPSAVGTMVLSWGITCAAALGLFYLGVFGGADAKAIMCIGLSFPFLPFTVIPGGVVVTTVLCAMLFSGVIYVAITLYKNLTCQYKTFSGYLAKEPVWKKIFVQVTGHPVLLNKIDHINYHPLENGEKLNLLSEKSSKNWEQQKQKLKEIYGKENPHIWATSSIPLIPFMLLTLVETIVIWCLLFT